MAHHILVPPLGQTTDTVTFSAWYKRVGDPVNEGEPLFAIETDKATLDIEAQASGVLAQVSAQPGDSVAVLSAIGVIAAEGEPLSSIPHNPTLIGGEAQAQSPLLPKEAHAVQGEVSFSPSLPTSPAPKGHVALDTGGLSTGRIFISPRARRLAEAEGVTWQALIGSGPEGAIVERDVRQYLSGVRIQKTEFRSGKSGAIEHPVAQSIPAHLPLTNYQLLTAQADVTAILMLAQRLNQRGISVIHRDVVLYLLGHALGEHPALVPTGVHVGVMLAGAEDFVAPVIHDANAKRLGQLAQQVADLSASAQAGALPADVLEGATFLFADLGAFGLDTATPGIMHSLSGYSPDIPMLSLGRVHTQREEQTVWLSLGFNPLNIKALAAIRLLQRLVQLIEDPDLALI